MNETLAFLVGLLVGAAGGAAAMWAAYSPALHVARLRADVAESKWRALLLDRKT
jgi:hypothetical protein